MGAPPVILSPMTIWYVNRALQCWDNYEYWRVLGLHKKAMTWKIKHDKYMQDAEFAERSWDR